MCCVEVVVGEENIFKVWNERRVMRSSRLVDRWLARVGLWFGNLMVEVLERLFPRLKDKEEDLSGLKDHYLQEFNLSNRERFKHALKMGLRIWFSLAFWFYGIILIGFLWNRDVAVFMTLFYVMSGILFLLAVGLFIVSYRIGFK
tara:strand:+ start:193 stop:627 length:435 start_codon:yes stop_codon:yes gene_type:complete